ncbi:hypothetical protein BDB00DRAFT_916219 [Zychaea mexicana]|uniref:uncharacterized protein n=1 Tax=Zychaea mexicana TaxID=64656 RepID=UPI0022FF433B|nr:uncharacterized protein BDB00DRAFT_916219 [Zychaea mexicana]KAI9497800.1 hypothetical protein BDB00DRAFT_916219 [Zychaea mexicana]
MVSTSSLLQDVLSDPRLLRSFESYLRRCGAHENLLFIEAMSQLRYESDSSNREIALNRIYKSFLTEGAGLELKNVTTKEQVRRDMEALQWAILRREDVIEVLQDTESQILAVLTTKLEDFIRAKNIHIDAFDHRPVKNQIRVVIIGGGFAVLRLISTVYNAAGCLLICLATPDSFEYTPGIVRRIVNPEATSSMRVRHDAYVRNGKVIIGYARDIGHDATSIQVNGETINFDYLVIATGSSYASQLKSYDVSVLYRLTGLEESNAELLNAKRVLIVGGGLVGCELASEIALRTFPGPYPHKHVTLVESHSMVISRSEAQQREKAMEYLLDLGIEVVCNERIIGLDGSESGGIYLGASGRVYSGYDKIFMATGTRPNNSLLLNSSDLDVCLDSWGRIRVKPTLQLDHWKYTHIFAGGDVTNVIEEKTGYAATLAGVCIARNICRLVKGKEPLRQGTKGTLPAPDKPLHGISAQGGIGKQKLGMLKKRFAFLNPSWAALKYFDEQQFLKMVQGEAASSSQALGRMPRRLTLPSNYASSLISQTSSLSLNSQPPVRPERRRLPPTPKQSRSFATYHPPSRSSKTQRDYHTWGSSSARGSSSVISAVSASSGSSSESSTSSLNDFIHNHFTYGAPDLPSHTEDVETISTKSAPTSTKYKYRRSSLPSVTSLAWDPPATPTSKSSART